MTDEMKKKDQRCYLFVGYAPASTSIREAEGAFNRFVSDSRRGWVVFEFAEEVFGGKADMHSFTLIMKDGK